MINISYRRTGQIKVTQKKVTVTLDQTDIRIAIVELIENEEQKLERWSDYKSDIIEDLKFALKYGVQELDLDHPIAVMIIRFAANTAAENPF